MPIKHAFNDFECAHCGEHYKLRTYALACEQSHDVIYVPIQRDDLRNLVHFIYQPNQYKDDKLLSDKLLKTLSKYTTYLKGRSLHDLSSLRKGNSTISEEDDDSN